MRLIACFCMLLLSMASYAQLNANKYISMARENIRDQKYTLAIGRLNFALKTEPYNVEAYFLRAMSKYNLGDYQGAVNDYTQCIRLNPNTASSFQNRGLSRSKLDDDYGAIEDFDRALKLEPASYFLYINKTYSQMKLELYEDAVNTCDRAISLNPYLESGYMMRGLAYTHDEQFDKAIVDFTKVIEISPENSEAYLRRSIAKSENLNPKGAMLDCDSAISMDSSSSMGYFIRANLQAKAFKYEKAIADYSKVIELNPNNALAHYNRGNARTKIDDYRGAAYDFSRVTDINPENILGHFNLALSYHKLDRYDLALDEYNKVIELYPDMEDAWFNRAFVKKHLGDKRGAQLDFAHGNAIRAKNRKKEFNYEEEQQLEHFTELDAEFYKPDFDEEKEELDLFNYPFFEISEVDYHKVNNNQLRYNIQQVNSFNEATSNQPYFYISHWLMPENRDSVSRLALVHKAKLSDANDIEKKRSLLWQAIVYKQDFDFNNSLATYDTLIEKYPLFTLAYFNKANTMLDLLELLLKLEPGKGDFIDMGEEVDATQLKDVQTLNIEFDKIERLYRQTLDADPEFYLAWFNIALVRSEKGDFEAALKAYDQAIKIKEDFAEAYYNRGVTHLYLQHGKKSCNDFSQAGELGIEEAYKLVRKYCK